MRFLLDTNILSDLVRHPRGKISDHIAEVGEEHVCTSIIVAAELRFGAIRKNSSRLAQLGAGGFDGFADAGDLVAGEIVHHDDIALAQDRDHELLDIGAKGRPIHANFITRN